MMTVEFTVILMLVTFIFGLFTGVSLMRPRR